MREEVLETKKNFDLTFKETEKRVTAGKNSGIKMEEIKYVFIPTGITQ